MPGMKRIRAFVIGLIACAICSVLSYHYGYGTAVRIQKGTFVVTLDALEDLRGGKIDDATKRVEALCFGAADIIYGDPSFRHEQMTVLWQPALKQYRATYRTNSADWSPMERDLEKELANWK
jgi:hypothetical protein